MPAAAAALRVTGPACLILPLYRHQGRLGLVALVANPNIRQEDIADREGLLVLGMVMDSAAESQDSSFVSGNQAYTGRP